MVMNKKGQMAMVKVMMFIMVFIAVVLFIDPLKEQISTSRSVSNLDCGNSSITTGNKATCIIVDWGLPYFIGIGLAAAAGYGLYKKKKEDTA